MCQLPELEASAQVVAETIEHEYGDDQAVGQQGADDGSQVARAADGAEVGTDSSKVMGDSVHAPKVAMHPGHHVTRPSRVTAGTGGANVAHLNSVSQVCGVRRLLWTRAGRTPRS